MSERLGYWAARVSLNLFAIGMFWLILKLLGVTFTWSLYWSAFVVYVILSLGDDLIAAQWSKYRSTHQQETGGS